MKVLSEPCFLKECERCTDINCKDACHRGSVTRDVVRAAAAYTKKVGS